MAAEATEQLVVVLTMGRVGSTSIHASIPERPGRVKYHVHSVNSKTLAKQVRRRGSLEKSARSVRHGVEAMAAIEAFAGRVKIVSLVRDVVSRETSSAFASLRATNDPEAVRAILSDPARTREFYWSVFSRGRPHVWFDNEIRDVFGIDVYDTPFPDEGWGRYSNGRFDLLVLRSESSRALQASVVGQFIGDGAIPLITKNSQTSSDAVARMYRQFKENLAFTESELREYAECRYQRHFYGTGIPPRCR